MNQSFQKNSRNFLIYSFHLVLQLPCVRVVFINDSHYCFKFNCNCMIIYLQKSFISSITSKYYTNTNSFWNFIEILYIKMRTYIDSIFFILVFIWKKKNNEKNRMKKETKIQWNKEWCYIFYFILSLHSHS